MIFSQNSQNNFFWQQLSFARASHICWNCWTTCVLFIQFVPQIE